MTGVFSNCIFSFANRLTVATELPSRFQVLKKAEKNDKFISARLIKKCCQVFSCKLKSRLLAITALVRGVNVSKFTGKDLNENNSLDA